MRIAGKSKRVSHAIGCGHRFLERIVSFVFYDAPVRHLEAVERRAASGRVDEKRSRETAPRNADRFRKTHDKKTRPS